MKLFDLEVVLSGSVEEWDFEDFGFEELAQCNKLRIGLDNLRIHKPHRHLQNNIITLQTFLKPLHPFLNFLNSLLHLTRPQIHQPLNPLHLVLLDDFRFEYTINESLLILGVDRGFVDEVVVLDGEAGGGEVVFDDVGDLVV